jgi:hypothetical protein
MTEEEAWRIIGVLSNETTGWNDDAADMYANEIMLWSDAGAAMAAVRNVCHVWMDRSRPPFAVIDEAYRVEIRERSAAIGTGHERPLCDGTGWITEHTVPCPRCNPYLAIIFQSPERLIRWRNGTPIKHLVDLDGLPVAACQTTNMIDPEDPIVPPSVGRMIAWSAYVADCNERDVEAMPREQFMKRLGTTHPTPERTP